MIIYASENALEKYGRGPLIAAVYSKKPFDGIHIELADNDKRAAVSLVDEAGNPGVEDKAGWILIAGHADLAVERGFRCHDRWRRAKTQGLTIALLKEEDADIIDWLSKQSNKSDAIRKAIRDEISATSKNH